jgi:acetyl esterase/lipase
MEDVRVDCDLPYKEIAGRQATMDVYRPPGATTGGPFPLVVMVHGNVDIPELLPLEEHWKRYNYRLGLALAAMGYVAVSFDYRGYRDAQTLAAAQQDVLDLLAFVRDGADEYGIDPDRVCVWGTSGGGLTMGWAAIHADPPVSCGIGFSVSMEEPAVPERDPVAALRADSPPFFLARGHLDGYARLRDFVERAEELGVEVIAEEHPRGVHGFEGRREPEQQRILARAFEFLEEHLGGA